MSTINPWSDKDIKDFLFLNCPQCPFKTKDENEFQKHALKNHPLSSVLFGGVSSNLQKRKDTSDQSPTKSKISKGEPESRKDEKCDICSFSCSERSDLVLHVQKEHFNNESSSNEISTEGQKIDPFCGSPEKRTLKERKSFNSVEFDLIEHLISEALNKAPKKALSLSLLFKAINASHPEYKMENSDWKAKVKSNLSINRKFQSGKNCWKFSKVEKKGRLSEKKVCLLKCPLCFQVFIEKDELSKHIDLEHDKFNELVDEFMSFRKEGGEPEKSCKLAIQNLVTELQNKRDQLGILLEVLLNQGKDLFRNRRSNQYFSVLMGHCVQMDFTRTFQTTTKYNNVNHV